MPIYEYQCKACGHRLEALQKMSEDALTDCPQCTQATLTKLVSAAAFRLKGQGWYETDFKNANQKGLADKDNGATDTTAAKPTDTATDKPSGVTADSGKTTDSSNATDKPSGKSAEKSAEKSVEKSTEKPKAAASTSNASAAKD